MAILKSINDNISMIIGVITIVSSISGAIFWANNNLASKNDILSANVLSEFRSIELHLSLNDYRLSEIESDVAATTATSVQTGVPVEPMSLNSQRIYDQIKQNSEALSVRRSAIISSGILSKGLPSTRELE
jgi:hypothetical protein